MSVLHAKLIQELNAVYLPRNYPNERFISLIKVRKDARLIS